MKNLCYTGFIFVRNGYTIYVTNDYILYREERRKARDRL